MTSFVASSALRSAWHPVAEGDDITDAPHAVTLLGDRYVIWRGADRTLLAAPDRCPHREAPLSAGTVAGGVLTCSYHGWSFGDGGRCVGVPSTQGAAIPPTAHLPCVRADERYGLVWICPGEPTEGIPVIAHEDDPEFRRINSGIQHWSVCATRMVDNFCDISHFPWVHTGTFGAGQSPLVAPIDLGELDDGWYGYAYRGRRRQSRSSGVDHGHHGRSGPPPHEHRVRVAVQRAQHDPVRGRARAHPAAVQYAGRRHQLAVHVRGVAQRRLQRRRRSGDHVRRAIGAEDQRMLEQVPGTMPLGRTGLVNVQADRASVEWRRRLAAMIGVDAGGQPA